MNRLRVWVEREYENGWESWLDHGSVSWRSRIAWLLRKVGF